MRKTFKRFFVLLSAAILTGIALAQRPYATEHVTDVLRAEAAEARDHTGDDPWFSEELIQPEELARLLAAEQKPVVLQIGIVHLYRLGHIPGSRYAGPASAGEGLDALKKEAKGISRTRQLVCYCGCCPWADCPNTRPAYKALREMGFEKIKVLYLPKSFTQDWVLKGLPVEKGGT